jgi:hypothetical protein
MGILTGKTGSCYIINTSTAFTDEPTTESTFVYTIDDTSKDIWNPNVQITISTGTLDTTYYDDGVNWYQGKVKLQETGETLTVSGEYVTLQKVGKISSWSMNFTTESGEVTEIGDTWKQFTPLAKSSTLTLNRYRFDTLFDDLSGDDLVLIKLYEEGDEVSGGSGIWARAIKTSFGLTKAINAVDTDTINLQVTGAVVSF